MKFRADSAGAFCGLLAPVVFLAFYITAIAVSPSYTFGANYLSDLGVMEGAVAFNSGIMIAGVLAVPFSIALWKALRPGKLALLGCVLLGLSGIALVSVGVFTEDFEGTHYAVSIAFFLLCLLTQVSLAKPLIDSPKYHIIGIVVTALTVVTVVVVVIVGINPLGETIAVFEILIWVLMVAIQTMRTTLKKTVEPAQ